jgi:DNA-binding transcriptional LysR family regulator
MIDIRDLEAFLAILESGSISRAAEEIGLTQPALSLKLKKMEQELGVTLFQRTPRSVVPLDAAKLIAPRARDILAKLDGVKESLSASISELRGQVRVGCLTGWFEAILVPCIGPVSKAAPNIRMRLHVNQTADLIHAVAHGRLDMAIVAQPFEKTDDLEIHKLLDEELVLVGNNFLKNASKEQRKRDLLSRPWVTMTVPDPLVDKWWRVQFDGQNFPWEEAYVPVSTDHITSIPSAMRALPNSVSVIPRQVVLRHSDHLEVAESIHGHNELFLIWRQNGMELRRYQLVREKIIEQANEFVAALLK